MSEFDRIAGYSDEKRELNDICKLFRRFDKLSDAGFRLPRGILLAGQPGVGKTVMAEAFIKESGVYCERISFDDTNKIAMTEYLDKKFKTAIEHLPAIVLMDELDKFVGDVSNGFNPTYDMNATRQILKVINDNVNDGLIVVATINDERMLSYALKRSGRFDRTLNIPLPDLNDRREIIAHYSKGKKFAANVDFETLAKITAKLSGADIECIINDAGLNAILADRTEINQADIDDAVNRLMFQASKSSCPDENDSKLVAAHEAGHLVAGLILKKDEVANASIIPQGDNSGHVKIGPPKNKIKTKSQYLNDIVISLAGKAAEKIFFPDEEFNSTGSDYSSAYFYIRDMFFSGLFGFDLYVSHFRESSGNDISEERLRLIEKKRAEVLDDCLHTAEKLLKSNIDLVNKYIEELTDKYTLTHDEIMAIYNQMRPEAA